MSKERIIKFWFIFSLAILALYYAMPKSAMALDVSAKKTDNEDANVLDLSKIPLLNRFRLKDNMESNGFNDEERRSIYYAYKEGRVGDEDYYKFYSSTEKPSTGQSWRRISFSVYNEPNKKLRVDINPKDKAVMLNYAVKLYGVK